jgi:hypothetical protein
VTPETGAALSYSRAQLMVEIGAGQRLTARLLYCPLHFLLYCPLQFYAHLEVCDSMTVPQCHPPNTSTEPRSISNFAGGADQTVSALRCTRTQACVNAACIRVGRPGCEGKAWRSTQACFLTASVSPHVPRASSAVEDEI